MKTDFEIYANKRIEFYNKFSAIKFSDLEKSKAVILKNEFFKNLNIQFEDYLIRRSDKARLSAEESRTFNNLLLERYPEFREIFEYNEAVIYWFKIIHSEKSTNTKVLKKYIRVRDTNKGWWSKPGKNPENNSEYLYLGKVEKNLKNRFVQHLGLGHKMTSSLKLCKWLSSLDNIDLEFQFIKLNKQHIPYLEDIENVLWRKSSPLIGQDPRIKEFEEE